MASIHKNGRYWHIFFRLGKKQFKPSLKTTNQREAENQRGVVEDTLTQLEMGRLALPPSANRPEIIRFVLSGGRQSEPPEVEDHVSIEQVFEEYFASYIASKEETTVYGERIHTGHFARILKANAAFADLDTDDLQTYAAERSKEDGLRGRKISSETVKKEFRTFDQIWKMAVGKGYVTGPSPTKGVKLALTDEKPPFMTWDEIETIIKRGGLTDEQQKEYWDCLFLDEKQVLELLGYVREKAEHPFIHAAIGFAAFTGARRSEIVRSQIEDWDFERGIVRIREKKGSHKKGTTFREVSIHPNLEAIMTEWLKVHPGGQFMIVAPANMANSRNKHPLPSPLTPDQAHDHFHRTLNGSKWKSLKGWHVLRHSFCSICARNGVPDSTIDAWMGHKGDEAIKKRYRHLFPADTRQFMRSLFSDPAAEAHCS
ncbi:MAG: tyrosine-type recombinase/integrase [Planctomycetota bacterium]|nr:tyrosine-type recombinase/integrase [Planctomycetota bacterium]